MTNYPIETITLIKLAYVRMKQEYYHDHISLFTREKIAALETSEEFEEVLNRIAWLVDTGIDDVEANQQLAKWLDRVEFRCIPKSVREDNVEDDPESEKSVKLLTNLRISDEYEVDKVNYFIDMPIELHIIDVLWCIVVGAKIDKRLSKYCLGNRINSSVGDEKTSSAGIFKIYHLQYAKWRDTAIKRGVSALEANSDILLIGMDIKECYYHLQVDWDQVVDRYVSSNLEKILTYVLERVYQRYARLLEQFVSATHPTSRGIQGLPIGLASSRVLCNWILSKFDNQIIKELKPLYYGRYVDDMLLVLQYSSTKKPDTSKLIQELLINTKILEKVENTQSKCDEYSLHGLPNLRIQGSKFIFQFFNHAHSHAGLHKFKKELEEQASEFNFLPEGEDVSGLDNCAFDVIYKGSINKLRSVIGLEENSTELSKYLSRRIMQYRLCMEKVDQPNLAQIFRFYKGRNIFDFLRLWEKVFTLFIVNNRADLCIKLWKECSITINKLNTSVSSLRKIIKKDLYDYLLLSLALPVGLKGSKFRFGISDESLRRKISRVYKKAKLFRMSNLIRHQAIAWPLINYTDFDGDLTDPQLYKGAIKDLSIKNKVRLTPRFIHMDEYQVFKLISKLSGEDAEIEVLSHSLADADSDGLKDLSKLYREEDNKDNYNIVIQDGELPLLEEPVKELCVAVANMKVSEDDIVSNYTPHRMANLGFARQAKLYEILNAAISAPKCDLLVLPEVSIPVAWLQVMLAFARKHQIGIVFGLEHIIGGRKASNVAMTLLPFRTVSGYKNCFLSARLKNYYAPQEQLELNRLGLDENKSIYPYYEEVRWRGVKFAVYNCYELSDIQHRGLFRSKIDFIAVIAWNKDVKYYSNIVEAGGRDLHCYVIHVNASQFGDSRILAPSQSYKKDIVRVSGGENVAVLKSCLDISTLRDFQARTYSEGDRRFKPPPAGFDELDARERAQDRSTEIRIRRIFPRP